MQSEESDLKAGARLPRVVIENTDVHRRMKSAAAAAGIGLGRLATDVLHAWLDGEVYFIGDRRAGPAQPRAEKVGEVS